MKTALREFMKRPTTWMGIIAALMFQIIFSVIWMTGYNGVTERAEGLRIAVVNEDVGTGEAIAEALVRQLPFDMVAERSLDAANELLERRDLQMVVHIPADFSQRVSDPEGQGQLHYYINESNPALIKSIMSGAAEQITAQVNRTAVAAGVQRTLEGNQMPAEQAAAVSLALSERVSAELKATNVVHGMHNQMVPMMMVLASFVGAMVMGMNLEQSAMAVAASVGRWRRFGARSAINVAAAAGISLAGSSLLVALGGQIEQGFLVLWGFQFLFLLTFVFVSQMFLYIFGMAGMLFNIMLLSAQLVSSGAIVPRELLSDFYTALGQALPATYAVDGNMNILFGGPTVGADAWALCLIGAASVAVSAVAVALKHKPRALPQSAVEARHGS